ncbi:DUF2336 domain-containing protein [Ancylobacter sp. MQZ15Z-1]|uniref:DUF2336 domain-containing protein n=1 Tax=Ancylobacter mangrovi TaxID=2972472 RepID=A0A9X2T0T0_9HYPH|nr:DUF2336 domain-containing protein [Ancylobacter mangrovi]MCS0494210.1 DUF2336 domain-containing protein [Ancylobacter mangrovi]
MPPTSGSGLKVLIEEARRRHDDTRPEMLRLLVELYLGEPGHDEAEQARFARLATRLIEAIEVPVAARLVRPLAARHDLPRELALQLAHGPLALAGPVLRLSPVLDDAALAALAQEVSPAHVAAIAARRDVSPALAKALAELVHRTREGAGGESEGEAIEGRSEDAIAAPAASDTEAPDTGAPDAETGVEHVSAPIEGTSEADPVISDAVASMHGSEAGLPEAVVPEALAPEAVEPAPSLETDLPDSPAAPDTPSPPPPPARPDYLAASPEDRALIIARLVTLPPLPMAERVAPASAETTEALLQAARDASSGEVAQLIQKALGVSEANAVRIVDDPSGQALAVAARALGLSFAVLSRVLFRLHPVAGRSAAEMTRLADMFDSLTGAGAQHLVASWRPGRRVARERGEDAPSMRRFGEARPETARTHEATRAHAEPGEARRPG